MIPNLGKGGAEKVLVNLVNHIDPERYEVYIFCLKKEGDLLSFVKHGVQVVDIDSPRAYFSIFAIRKAVKKIRPHVLFGWLGHVNAILAFFRPMLPRDLVLLCRESSIPSLFIRHYTLPFLFKFLYRFYNRYDGIVCQSVAMKDDLVNNFNVKPGKIRVISNPVVPSVGGGRQVSGIARSFLSGNNKKLLFVGRFSAEKRVQLIIESLALLPNDFKLVIIGYGGFETELRSLINNKGLSERVLIINDCNDPTPYYKLADCVLLSSSFEGFPNVLLEANMQGCPVVVYETRGGAREIVNSNNGIYINPGSDLEIFADSILEACLPGRFDRGQISEQTEKEYNIGKKTSEYLDYIEGFLTTTKHPL